jgi:hypothetical protein
LVALWSTSSGGRESGVTKVEDWPMSLQWAFAVLNAAILITLMVWTSRTRKGWYIAGGLLGIEAIAFLLVR